MALNVTCYFFETRCICIASKSGECTAITIRHGDKQKIGT